MGRRFHKLPQGNVFVDIVHERIHQECHYIVHIDEDPMAIDDILELGIITPVSTLIEHHFTVSVTTALAGEIYFYEGSTFTGGAAVTAFNNNRRSTNTTTLLFVKDPTVTADGTELTSSHIGSGSGPRALGGVSNERQEFILHENLKYVVRFKSLSNDNDAHMSADFYENS